MPNNVQVQTALLKVLSDRNTDTRLGKGQHYLADEVCRRFDAHERPARGQIMAAAWQLIAQGLAYIDYSQSAPENWRLLLTDAGSAAAHDQDLNPDSPGEYLQRLREMAPGASELVLDYAKEAVSAYAARCYLASAVMLGVASEAAFLELGRSFGKWPPAGQQTKFLQIFENKKGNYIQKFTEFRKRIEPLKPQLPEELADGMALTFDSVLDLLRIYRNDVGHPTGKKIFRDDAFINLQMFARFLGKLYQFRGHFEKTSATTPSSPKG